MVTKNLDEHFKPKLDELEKIKRQKELLEKFPGELFIDTLTDQLSGYNERDRKRAECITRDYSLAEKIQIMNLSGHYTPGGVKDSDDEEFCIFNLYFELKDDKYNLCIPVYCRHENLEFDKMNVIYNTHTSYRGHYDEFETTRRFHPKPLDEIISFYEIKGVKKELLFDLYTQINDLRKAKPAEIILGGRR